MREKTLIQKQKEIAAEIRNVNDGRIYANERAAYYCGYGDGLCRYQYSPEEATRWVNEKLRAFYIQGYQDGTGDLDYYPAENP